MPRTPRPLAPDATSFERSFARDVPRLAVLLPAVALLALVVARGAALGAGSTPPLAPVLASPEQLTSSAADQLEDATKPGGTGYSFEIVQTSTITARPGGPKIDVPDPTDPNKSLGLADEYLFYSLIERGTVTPDGFWSELRVGPPPGEKPDFEKAEWRRSALVRDGVGWRNDREGWYEADVLPGIGLDPETAALLPRLLRNAEAPMAKGNLEVDGATLTGIEATGKEADMPGLVAAKGAAYTRLTAPIEYGFDERGRLARIHAVALNTTMTEFDLVVDTVIVLRYDDPPPLPEPVPTWQPTTRVED